LIPTKPTFQPITLGDRAAFIEAAAILNRASCECSFVNLFAWKDVYDHVFTRVDGRLLVVARSVRSLLFPLGAWFPPAELERIRQTVSDAIGLPLFWGDVPPDYVEAHGDELKALYQVGSLESEEDYLYRTGQLAAVKGNCHQNTRRLLRHFEREVTGSRLVPLDAAAAPALIALARHLQQEHPVAGADQERMALTCALEHFSDLGLEGLQLLDAQGRLMAFSLWSFVTPSVADVHFEKAIRDQAGTAQQIRIGVARTLLGRAEWMNLEQDVGSPGLRQAKRSYCPDLMLKRYRLNPHREGAG